MGTNAYALFTGWGRGGWGSLGWGEGSITVDPAVGAVGSVTVTTTANINAIVTGVSATGSVGSATVEGAAIVSTTGVSGTASVGSVTVASSASVSVTGLSATGSVDTASVVGTSTVTLLVCLPQALLAIRGFRHRP
jgi:hypothetical protein